MGSCVSSSHHNNTSSSDSALKLPALISKPDTIATTLVNEVISPSTINNGNPPPLASAPQDSGNEDEMMFFDSRGWLDSDCEDDFMSVDGEFTPSRGTTPVHHKFCDQTPPDEAQLETKHEQQPSSIDNKKRLLELFKETQDDDDDHDQDQDQEDDVAEVKSRTCLWLRTPITSSAPATPFSNDRDRRQQQQQQLKRVRSAARGGCVPRLVSCNSFTERRRKMIPH